MAGSEATLGTTLGHGDWQTPGHSVLQQLHAQVYMTSFITILLSQIIIHPVRHLALYCYNIYYALLLQLLLRSYDLDRNSNYYVSMIYIVTPTITSLWSILLHQLLGPYDPYCYSTYYVTKTSILQQLFCPYDLHWSTNYHVPMIYIVTTTIRSIWPILLQYLLRH